MDLWLDTIGSILVVSVASLIGVFTLSLNEKRLGGIIKVLVSFSAGALLGGAFLHLLPEIVEEVGFSPETSLLVVFGIFLFFMLERALQWRHCHVPTSKHHVHPLGYMNLVGDGVHNFMDGMIIAGSYLGSVPLGITTTFAVLLHEIPQEMGDFGVLLHAGFDRKRALLMNFGSALVALLGGVLTLLLGSWVEGVHVVISAIAAGGFIYIAGSDLLPEMHKECAPKASIIQILTFLLGIGVMYAFTLLE